MDLTWKNHLVTAEGYLEIGLPTEAHNEIEKMTREDKLRPEICFLSLQIYSLLGKWDYARGCAERLAMVWAEKSGWRVTWAACVRRLEGIAAAEKVLQQAIMIFPEDPVVLYHLACVAALTGEPCGPGSCSPWPSVMPPRSAPRRWVTRISEAFGPRLEGYGRKR